MVKPRRTVAVRSGSRRRSGVWGATLALAAALSACTAEPVRVGAIGAVWVESPNFNDRRPSYVVLHHTTNVNVDVALRTLTDPLREVSAHYVVARDGTLYQLVDERRRAWHAGRSQWGADSDLNSSSIGIELDNTGFEPFGALQIEALLRLLGEIKTRYRIPQANFVGHADIAPGRKVDPSAQFPWRLLAEHGFGLWCDPPFAPAPPQFDPMVGLQAFGYDTRAPENAVHSFKLHFTPADASAVMTQADADLLHCLLERRTESLP